MRALRNLAMICLCAMPTMAFGKDGRLRCRADGVGGREAEIRVEGNAFRAKWEIREGEGQELGTLVNIRIDGVFVGAIELDELEDGELEGDLRQDVRNLDVRIRAGSLAQIGGLTCRFRRG